MLEKIADLLEKVDLAVAESVGVIDETRLERVARLRNQIKLRLEHPDDLAVIALVGGTGSGKSSILNAVAGADVAETGGLRPTTAEPMALVPEDRERSVAGLLDALGIHERVGLGELEWLCLLDLPDTDSVIANHRLVVEELIPKVDGIVWVFDPEKYRDMSIHAQIAAQKASQGRFLFVLNQVDRLDATDIEAIADDLTAALAEDGIEDPAVLEVAADPAFGPPVGVSVLLEALAELLDHRALVMSKLTLDLQTAVDGLVEATGGAKSLDFEHRWEEVKATSEAKAREGRVSEAGHDVARFLDEIGAEMGNPEETSRLSESAPVVVDDSVRRSGAAGLGRTLDEEIADPLRTVLAARARCHAAIADLAMSVARVNKDTA